MNPNEFYTLEQACDITNRTPKMLDIYCNRGLLTKYKVLGNVVFLKSEIGKLLTPQPVEKTA